MVMFRYCGDSVPSSSINLYKNSLSFALMVPTVIIAGDSYLGFSLNEYLIIASSGIIGIAVADTFYLEALKRLGAGRTGIVGSLYSPFVVIGSLIFLNESLSLLQWFGFASVMCGVLLVAWEQDHMVSAKHSLQGFAFGVAAIMMMAVAIIMVKPILESKPFFSTTALRTGFALFAMIVVFFFQGKLFKIPQHFKGYTHWKTLTIASILGTYISMMFWLAGYKLTSAAISSILNETASIFILLLARLFIKESLSRPKIIGSLFTTTGVLLVIFGK